MNSLFCDGDIQKESRYISWEPIKNNLPIESCRPEMMRVLKGDNINL